MNSEGVEDFNTRYFYPSENDPLLASSDGIEAPLWNEAAAENLPGDRQMLGSAGPFTLEPGDIHYIDLAFVFLEAGTGGMSNEQLLDERLKSVKLFFNNELEQCQSEPLFLGQQELDPKLITFYPNPMYDIFSISTPHSWNNITLEIVDIAGNLVTSKTISGGIQQINIEDLSAGTYALKLQYGEQLLTQKIIVQ